MKDRANKDHFLKKDREEYVVGIDNEPFHWFEFDSA